MYEPRYTVVRSDGLLVLCEHGVKVSTFNTRQLLADAVHQQESEARALRRAYDKLIAEDVDALMGER